MTKQFSFNVKTVLFKKIQASINNMLASIWPIDRNLSGAITPGQIGYGSDDNKVILRIPKAITIQEPLFQIV